MYGLRSEARVWICAARPAGSLPQEVEQLRRAEVDREVPPLREDALELDAQRPPDATPAAVTTDEVRRCHRLDGPVRRADDGTDTIRVLVERLQGRPEPELDPGLGARRPLEQGQERELGEEGRAFRGQTAVLPRRPVADAVVELGEHVPGHGRREHDAVREVRGRRRLGARLLRAAPAPEMLHRPGEDRLTGGERHASVALIDQRHRYPAPAQLDREGEPHRPGADDQHAPFLGHPAPTRHAWPPSVPASTRASVPPLEPESNARDRTAGVDAPLVRR